MGLNYEKGYAALKEALPPEQRSQFDQLYALWQQATEAKRKYGDTEQLRHDRIKLYEQFLKLAQTINFDLHSIVMGE